jgi:hypothetical protein
VQGEEEDAKSKAVAGKTPFFKLLSGLIEILSTSNSISGSVARHSGAGWGSGTVDMPADLPKLGKVNAAAGKVVGHAQCGCLA